MYRLLLVPLDGSELAEGVLEYAKELASRLDLEMVLLHVYSPGEREFAPMRKAYIERAALVATQSSTGFRKKIGLTSGNGSLKVSGVAAMGDPAEEILAYAEKNDVSLILMGTHGYSGVRRWAIGSVADKVLRASKVPVLLVRAQIPREVLHDELPQRIILVPLDGSELAESVLPHVEALARQRGLNEVQVILLGICEPPLLPAYYPPEMPYNWDDHVDRCKRANEQYLGRIETRLRDAGLDVSSRVIVGSAAEEIVNFANLTPHNMIVMATHGRSGLGRWVFGSVAERVLQGVSTPVFLVRPAG